MSRQILAIDVRNEALTAVLVTTSLKSNAVTDCVHMPLVDPPEDGDPLTHSLALLIEKLKPTAPNVVVSLPADKSLFRFVSVPFKEDNKIRQVLPYELEPSLPISTDNLKIDFQKSICGDQTEVLAVAIDQSVLNSYMSRLNAAGIRPQLVVPAGFPLITQLLALEDAAPDKAILLDVNADKTTLFAFRSGRVEMVRNLPSGVKDEADTEALALRIRQTITAWNDIIHDDTTPDVIYASGPGLGNADEVQRLREAIDMNVQNLDLRHWLPRVEIPDDVQWQPNLMNEALALAILDAEDKACPNFHRISSPLRNYWSAYRPYLMVPAVLLALVLIIAASGVLLDNYYLKKRADELHSQMEQVFKDTFPGTKLTASPLDQMQSKLNELKKGGKDSERNAVQTRSIDILLQLSQSIPDNIDVLLSRMTIDADEAIVSGETTDFNTVDDIKSRLEKSELFKQITIASANMDKSGKKVLFKLKIDI